MIVVAVAVELLRQQIGAALVAHPQDLHHLVGEFAIVGDGVERRQRGVERVAARGDLGFALALCSRWPSLVRPSQRTTAGSPRPEPDQRDQDDAERTNRIRSRWGKASPPGSVSGSASAAASDTAPRTPVNATTNTARQSGSGSRVAQPLAQQRGR